MAMKDGVCPECGSEDIRAGKGAIQGINVALFIPVSVDVRVCADCGYIAAFVKPPELDIFIRKKWKPAQKSKNDD